MSLASMALGAGRADATTGRDVVDIITFIEAPWGLRMALFPVQRVILKAYYGVALDNNPHGFPLDVPIPTTHPAYDPALVDVKGFYKYRVPVYNWRRELKHIYTEEEYLAWLFSQGRCNIGTVTVGQERRELVLSVGRRSGKTEMSSCIAAYETYRLLSKGDPQAYYGIPPSENIQLISFATDKDQAGILYQKVSGYFRGCAFFAPYTANNTQTYARFQTPQDIKRYGSYQDDPTSKATIKVTFRSSVAKGSRGAGNIVVILDEMAHFTDNGQSSADAVYSAVLPSTTTFAPKNPKDRREAIGPLESKIISISSPLGRQGVFYQLFMDGFKGGAIGDTRLCVQAPTWEVNPTIPADAFEGEYVKDPRTFFTEFGAEFSDRTRGWLEDAKDLLACVNKDLRPRVKAAPLAPHFMGIDFALVGDASAIAIGHLDEKGRIVLDVSDSIQAGVGDFAAQERLEFADVVDWIYGYTRKFYITEAIFDQWAGIPFEQALQSRGLKQFEMVHHTQQLTSQMYQNFKDMMFGHRLMLYDWPIPSGKEHGPLIEQLLELQAEYKSKYVTLVHAPKGQGKHDDLADALVRMVWLASQRAPTSTAILAGTVKMPGVNPLVQRTAARAIFQAKKKALQSGSSPERQIPKKLGFGSGPPGLRGGLGTGRGGGRGGFGGTGGFGRR
jgi:hypothetical protein